VGGRRERGAGRGAPGGIVGEGTVTLAAHLALYGLPAWHFLTTRDREERLLLTAVVKRAQEIREHELKALASYIAAAMAGKRL